MWTYIDAWRSAADALGVEIEGPVAVSISPSLTLLAPMLVKGFGAPKGTLVFPSSDDYRIARFELEALGFTASAFGPYRDGEVEAVSDLIELLTEWSWCGNGSAPEWSGHRDS